MNSFFKTLFIVGMVLVNQAILCSIIPKTVQAEDAFTFRGVKIGVPLSDQMRTEDISKMDIEARIAKTRSKELYADHSKDSDHADIYNAPPFLLANLHMYADLIDGNVEKITSGTQYGHGEQFFIEAKDVITSKYGKPKKVEKETVQNRLGAKRERMTAMWKVKNVIIFISSLDSMNGEGSICITSDKYMQKIETETKQRMSKGAGNI